MNDSLNLTPDTETYDVIVKCFYYHRRSLLIADVNWLMENLFHKFGYLINITFLEIDPTQKSNSIHLVGSEYQILAIDEPIHLYIYDKEMENYYRDKVLENQIKNGKRKDLI